MRALIFSLLITSSFSWKVFAAGKKCKDLDAKVTRAIESQKIMSQRGIKGEIRQEMTSLLDRGVEIDPMFFQHMIHRKGFKTTGFKDKGLLVGHAKKHGDEFNFVSDKQYLRNAEKFARSSDDNIISFRSKNDIYRYNPVSNEFQVIERSGKVIGTYYRPDLRKLNAARKRENLPPFKSVTEWFIKNKWERFVLNSDFKK
ncbi:hypothetical protein ABMA79_01895 [Halobacteriovorax sp. HFRX-2_2]|uniref:hypothetical protein n=1 Tax=unclassified Halobacteriovorax TaxID=2639665 RepID=UPI003713BC60